MRANLNKDKGLQKYQRRANYLKRLQFFEQGKNHFDSRLGIRKANYLEMALIGSRGYHNYFELNCKGLNLALTHAWSKICRQVRYTI